MGSLNSPPILFATVLSSCLLIHFTLKWLRFLREIRFRATHDVPALITGLWKLVASFFAIGLLDGWLASYFYKTYYGIRGAYRLEVPIPWVWLVGILTIVIFYGRGLLDTKRLQS